MSLSRTLLTFPLLAMSLQSSAGEVEVLHWWTSGGEAKSVEALKDMLEAKGHSWKDFAIAGGGGDTAMTVLKTRAVSGNPPSAAQIKGHNIREWAELGFLTDLNQVADEGHWKLVVPPVIDEIMRWQGDYVAVPVNVHRVNWLWANPEVFKQVGVEIPSTLDEFYTAADKIKAAGYIPLAHGGQAWQNATLFETIALSVLGSEGYTKAFVDLDPATLSGEKMVEVFTHFKRFKQYVDTKYRGRSWSQASEMVIEGEAAMQIMGDWAKGEFAAAGKQPGVDYVCAPAPGTADQFTYNMDSFTFFELQDESSKEAQHALAATIMDKEFQQQFNLNKGSIPVRLDMDMTGFDICAQESMKAFKLAGNSGDLVPSISQGMSTTAYAQDAIFDVVTNFFNESNADPERAAKRLANAVRAAI
ncbi:ABC transporter substrate-binding protein [Vibrio maerlii]|uniref:ABC transporter substrate-binding protein n=1 Tax=Vibrio maerlii TaxID=2231648 RepID=UPI000E3C5C71|nr:ABC transporter substrate-binding protein [Vibrio maerlii]